MSGPEPDPTSSLPGMGIWGWMLPTELRWLGEAAAEMESVAEVGCLHGRSAFMLLTSCRGTVYCIDPWEDEGNYSYPSFMSYCGHFQNLVAIRGRSPGAASEVGDVDMTFLDGAHAYGAVLADIAAWLPKTRRLLCGHDYRLEEDAGFPGVAEAVHAVFGEERVVVPEGTSIWAVDLSADRSVLASAPSGEIDYVDEYGYVGSATIGWPT